MKTFEITAPDGKVYEVEGPDDATEEQALEQVKAKVSAKPSVVVPRGTLAPGMSMPKLPGTMDQANALATGAMRGLTLGFDNELLGAGYGAERDRLAESQPGAHMLGQFVGGGYGGAGITGALGATARGKAALDAFNKAGLMKKGGMLAGTGAVVGGIGGAGEAEGNRLSGAASGAVTGAALNTAIPGGIAAINSAVVRPVSNLIQRSTNPQQYAVDKLATAFARDELPTGYARSKLRQAGGLGTIAESGGRNVETLGDLAAVLPGPAQQAATRTMTTRLKPQAVQKRFESKLLEAVAVGDVDTYDAVKTLHKNMTGMRADYEYAVNTGTVPMRAELEKLLISNDMKRALGGAQDIITTDIALGRADAGLESVIRFVDEKPVVQPTLRAWDYVKRALDADVSAGTDEFGKLTPKAERSLALKRNLVNLLDKNDDYKRVRGLYAEQKSAETAVKFGRGFMREDAEQLDDILEDMSPAEMHYFKIGAARAMRDKVLGSGTPATALRQLQRGPMAAKVRQVFDDERSYQKFMRALRNEANFAQAPGKFGRGAQTAGRQALMEEGAGPDPTVVADALRGAGRWFISDLARSKLASLMKLSEPARAALKPMFSTDPAEQAAMLRMVDEALAKRKLPRGITAEQAGLLGVTAGAAGRGAGGLLSQ